MNAIRTAGVVLALLPSLSVVDLHASQSTSAPPTMTSVLDSQLGALESQFTSAAEAMPSEKYGFAPISGAFDGVRTFALEIRHVATANTAFYSAILGSALPPGVTVAGAANGPEDIRSKDDILAYLKRSFALGHQALAALTTDNALTPLPSSPVPTVTTRLGLAAFASSHAWDHYGQMAEYLRMNGIVPSPSAGQPPANPRRSPESVKSAGGQHAFDFEIGAWRTHVRRLLRPLTGSTEWVDLDGTSVVRAIWDGRANLGELDVANATLRIEGLSLRVYDPGADQWSIYWANSREGRLGTAMVGQFKNGRGEFFDQELLDGKAIFVRFIFSDISATTFRLEQAFSADGGRTWEPNWIATFTRQA